MLQMMLKRQNVSRERVCLFATVWKCAVYKFTHRYTNYLFCAGRLIALIYFLGLFALFFLSTLLSTQNSSLPIKNKKRGTPQLCCFVFLYSAFRKCTLVCSTAVPSRVFSLSGTHTQTHRSSWTNQSGCVHFIFLVPLNCMEIITILINYCKKMFY